MANQPLFWLRPALGEIHSLLKDVQVAAAQTKAWAGRQAVIPAEPPHPGRVASRLGKIFFSEGEVAIAKTLFQQALQSNPNHHKALLGLAEIAVRENDPATAIANARQALATNHYHAETLSAWSILLAAGRQSGTDVLDATLLANLAAQAPAGVRARATLLIVKNLRGQGDVRWRQITANWLQAADTTDTTNKIVAAELRKLNLAQARITNPAPSARQQLAQAVLQTPGISPGEWLSATKSLSEK